MSEIFVKYKYVAEDDKHPAFIIVILRSERGREMQREKKILSEIERLAWIIQQNSISTNRKSGFQIN